MPACVLQSLIKFIQGGSKEADVPNIAPEATSAIAGKRPRGSAVASAGGGFDLMKHERKLRCRDNLFLVANKDFSKLDAVYKRAEAAFMAEYKKFVSNSSGGSSSSALVRLHLTCNERCHSTATVAVSYVMCPAPLHATRMCCLSLAHALCPGVWLAAILLWSRPVHTLPACDVDPAGSVQFSTWINDRVPGINAQLLLMCAGFSAPPPESHGACARGPLREAEAAGRRHLWRAGSAAVILKARQQHRWPQGSDRAAWQRKAFRQPARQPGSAAAGATAAATHRPSAQG